jgi:hypothetical protein
MGKAPRAAINIHPKVATAKPSEAENLPSADFLVKYRRKAPRRTQMRIELAKATIVRWPIRGFEVSKVAIIKGGTRVAPIIRANAPRRFNMRPDFIDEILRT